MLQRELRIKTAAGHRSECVALAEPTVRQVTVPDLDVSILDLSPQDEVIGGSVDGAAITCASENSRTPEEPAQGETILRLSPAEWRIAESLGLQSEEALIAAARNLEKYLEALGDLRAAGTHLEDLTDTRTEQLLN